MSLSSLFSRGVMLPIVLASLATGQAHAAPPPAPAGWTATAQGDVEIYGLEQDGHHAELRLFPTEVAPASFDDWFAARIARPMQGVLSEKFVAQSPQPSPTYYTAIAGGRDGAGARLGLVRAGCQRADRTVVFAEMVFPDDPATARPAVNSAFALFTAMCKDSTGATASAAGKAAAAAPAAKLPPSREYAFQTAVPGTGIKASQIEAILMYWTNDQAGMTMQVHTYFYLVLKDGSFRDGLPPAVFADVDVAAAKKGEPALWGHWTRNGNLYHLVWPNKFNITLDSSALRQPARPGEMLDGLYRGFSAFSTGYSVSSSEWSVQFSRDGHFIKSANRSVVGSAGGMGGVGGAVISDDKGTTSTMGGSNFATSRSRSGGRPASSRSGTYKLDGYSIELDYDNGVVERRPFCTTSDRQSIWFEGDELSRPR
jgi:hypothetical protein